MVLNCSECLLGLSNSEGIYICSKCNEHFHVECLFDHLQNKHEIIIKDGIIINDKVISTGTRPY